MHKIPIDKTGGTCVHYKMVIQHIKGFYTLFPSPLTQDFINAYKIGGGSKNFVFREKSTYMSQFPPGK